MGIRVIRKDNKLTVETSRDSGVMHALVQNDRGLRAGMKLYNINSVEVNKPDPDMYDVKKKFDKKYKEKTGSQTGYFYP